ncbi:unnamed protein product [Lampetra planeri]
MAQVAGPPDDPGRRGRGDGESGHGGGGGGGRAVSLTSSLGEVLLTSPGFGGCRGLGPPPSPPACARAAGPISSVRDRRRSRRRAPDARVGCVHDDADFVPTVRPGCFFVPRTVAFTASVRHRACIPRPVPLCGCTTRPHGVRHRQHRQQQR